MPTVELHAPARQYFSRRPVSSILTSRRTEVKVEKESYTAPTISTIGTLVDLTRGDPQIDKCGGSGDLKLPQLLDNKFSFDCP